ncbi:hypothetical protein [Alkalihalobacillus sp. BA299]|uniref:hypothetical protein n=1 Tax=Alkalihalobacillus sp. BA299 TaxID=2815938 RepID=UPI001ADC1F0C|nr:hypothetical protein [Alkalihalobacillus sp. BA299]
MNVTQHVLPEDLEMAIKLHHCSIHCLKRAFSELEFNSDYKEAQRWVNDFQKCYRELEELSEKKLQHDKWERQLIKISEDMKMKGIEIQIIRRNK